MPEPTDKDMATLLIAALIYVFDKEQRSPKNSFDAAKEFIAEAEKELPEVFSDG